MKNASQYHSARAHRRDRRFNKDATTQFAAYRNRFSLTRCACHAFIHINQADPTDNQFGYEEMSGKKRRK
jgi:hypothetical protein